MEIEFRGKDGDVYCTAFYDKANHWIYANWIGYVSTEKIMEAGLAYIQLVQETG